MGKQKVIELINKVQNGTIGTIEYKSSVPVSAAARKEGVVIESYTKKFVRFGAAYKNLVEAVSEAEVKPRTNNYSWIIENKVAYNSNTGLDYVRISNIKKKTISRKYVLTLADGTKAVAKKLDAFAMYLTPSTLNGSGSTPVVQNIKLDNVIAINGVTV